MEFTKMHGLGNDYIYLNCLNQMPENPSGLARKLSDRHFGVGGDGLILICPSDRADFRMRMFNADGSEGAMCGNGIRCVGKYVFDKGLTGKEHLTIETASGIRELSLHPKNGCVDWITVDMGVPEVGTSEIITVNGIAYTGVAVSVGNPHFVIPTEKLSEVNLTVVGPSLEHHPRFPQGANIEFVRVKYRRRIELRVWERGSGETMACGTGACAALAALCSIGLTDREADVVLPGGELKVSWREQDGHLLMGGPAVTVFEGRISGEA